jgi:hypothetical protein
MSNNNTYIPDQPIKNNNEQTPSYVFIHPLKHGGLNTYFNVSNNIKSDLDLENKSHISETKLYDIFLSDIENTYNIEGVECEHRVNTSNTSLIIKTKSQQRVYEEITNTVFCNSEDIERSQYIIDIIGTSLNSELLESTVIQQELIETHIIDKVANSEFYDSYNYIDYKPLDFINRSSKIMGFLNVYTLSTPLISILMPLIIILIPFFTIRVGGLNMSFSSYFFVLKNVLSKIPAFRIFTVGTSGSISSNISAMMGIILYFVQMYYNTKYCYRYVDKNHDIHNIILTMKKVINNTSTIFDIMTSKLHNTADNAIGQFYELLYNKKKEVDYLKNTLSVFEHNYNVISINHINTIGEKLKIYYECVTNYNNIKNTLKSIFDINTFFYYYMNIYTNIQNGYINTSILIEDKSREDNIIKIDDFYFPMLLLNNKDSKTKQDIVYNNISLDKSFIISGPNASGKTTILKSVLFNILLTQQFGCGFYKKYEMTHCFSIIESYINIVDTHDRNSLFQNEAMRMLEIINNIENYNLLTKENTEEIVMKQEQQKHMFFVFDELFSGTNPKEATACGISCLKNILTNINVRFLLTTHYEGICNYFNTEEFNRFVLNKKMKCYYNDDTDNNSDINYTYEWIDGISNIYGGLTVLRDLRYSKEIIECAKKILEK